MFNPSKAAGELGGALRAPIPKCCRSVTKCDLAAPQLRLLSWGERSRLEGKASQTPLARKRA